MFLSFLGYYFTNLSCAIKFILDMDADSLRMNTEEFEAYTTGRRTAPVLLNSSVIFKNMPLSNYFKSRAKTNELFNFYPFLLQFLVFIF